MLRGLVSQVSIFLLLFIFIIVIYFGRASIFGEQMDSCKTQFIPCRKREILKEQIPAAWLVRLRHKCWILMWKRNLKTEELTASSLISSSRTTDAGVCSWCVTIQGAIQRKQGVCKEWILFNWKIDEIATLEFTVSGVYWGEPITLFQCDLKLSFQRITFKIPNYKKSKGLELCYYLNNTHTHTHHKIACVSCFTLKVCESPYVYFLLSLLPLLLPVLTSYTSTATCTVTTVFILRLESLAAETHNGPKVNSGTDWPL